MSLAAHADNRVAIAHAGAKSSFVLLLCGDGSDGVKKLASWALVVLGINNAANQVAITRAGANAPLVSLLRCYAGKGAAAKKGAVWLG